VVNSANASLNDAHSLSVIRHLIYVRFTIHLQLSIII